MPPISESQFLEAYDEYSDAIFRHCAFRTSDREEGKDLMQDTFIKTWKHIADGKEVENIRAFLYRVANNCIIDHLRKRKTRPQSSLEDLQETGWDVQANEDTTRDADIHFSHTQVQHILTKIDEPYKTAVILRYIDELSPKEIADLLKISANTVFVRISRGLKMLQDFLSPEHG